MLVQTCARLFPHNKEREGGGGSRGGNGKGKWVTMYSTHTLTNVSERVGWPFSTYAIRYPRMEKAASTMTMSRVNPTIISSRALNWIPVSNTNWGRKKKLQQFLLIFTSYGPDGAGTLPATTARRNLNFSSLTLWMIGVERKPGRVSNFCLKNQTPPLHPQWKWRRKRGKKKRKKPSETGKSKRIFKLFNRTG